MPLACPFFLLCLTLVVVVPPSGAAMKGPGAAVSSPPAVPGEIETSGIRLAFLGLIRGYQRWVSPTGGDRCGFRPSCSRYGAEAIRSEGPLVGLLMTADRLMRCNIFKRPGPDYTLMPDRRLWDPPSKNLLFR